jgi:hypothetical protein
VPLPSRSSEARSRTRDPRHDGTAQAIRDALARSPEPLSVYKLFLATGIRPEKIRDALSAMITRTGQVVSTKGPKGAVYSLFTKQQSKAPADSGSGRIAGRITIPQFNWNGTRLG